MSINSTQGMNKNYAPADTIIKRDTIPASGGGFFIRTTVQFVPKVQAQPKNPLDNYTPGVEKRVEVYDGKKVEITKTTTIDKQKDGSTVISVVEESKYHKSTNLRKINPDGSQESKSNTVNKVKTCKMPAEFAQKYFSSQVKIGEVTN